MSMLSIVLTIEGETSFGELEWTFYTNYPLIEKQ